MEKRPSTVLVYVGLDRVGDSLLKLPFVRGLRTAFPEARITWLAGKETSVYATIMAPVAAGLLDEVIENAGVGRTPGELWRRPLNGRRFDLIIDTQRILWASLSLWRIPHQTFISPAARFMLSSKKPPKGYRFPPSMQRQMLDLLELASGRCFATPEVLDLEPGRTAAEAAARLFPDVPVYVGIAPGSGGAPKCWPLNNFVALAGEQAARGRIPVFVLGPKEADWKDDLQRDVPEALFPLQTENHDFSPLFTIALAKRFAAAVANDSGAGHMFAVSGTPLVSLFGRTAAEKFRPMSRRLTIIKAQDYGGRELCFIPVDSVIEAVEKALESDSLT